MKVTAIVKRSGDWWAVEVPEVPGVFTQARRLDQVGAQVADAVSTMLAIDAAEVEVTLDASLDSAAQDLLSQALETNREAARRQLDASLSMRKAVARLRRVEKLSTRDTAALLGVSHQRVSQLETSTGTPPTGT